ncbi:hypothetical protein [Spiroplasma alleghenense]|uniref:Uncharacterized protein n=1 Tax=Spiroplasma alleghenense TaxID=216931 RepID=A0A345Z3P0_9MOLU|nr:hypothetical protein [Spiroplasma alleghenense]AXK51219.1 hypothetical protein SALLE_v1c05450 [Spiroplasma alleghenense]
MKINSLDKQKQVFSDKMVQEDKKVRFEPKNDIKTPVFGINDLNKMNLDQFKEKPLNKDEDSDFDDWFEED